MRNVSPLVVPVALLVAACGSADGTAESGKKPSSPAKSANASSETGKLERPALREGYTRFETITVDDLQPGDDVTRCQYVMAPVERDMDIMDIRGAQSKFGHHAAAFSYTPPEGQEVGSEVRCMMGDSTEFTSGASDTSSDPALSGGGFLGAVGPVETPRSLPDGVAFRLKKGQGIMMNLHYINTGLETASGEAYLDMKLVEIDPSRPIAALFLNFNSSFNVAPNAEADSSVDCVAGSDVNIVMMSNHMHEYGTRASTQVIRKDTGEVEMLHDDPTWTGDMANNPTFTKWSADSPFVLHTGDTIRTSCAWQNTTAQMLGFPREMCISAGFALASGDTPKAPACFNGAWIGQGI